MKRITMAAFGLMLVAGMATAQPAKQPVDTTTPSGERIRLFPDGHWEYLDGQKAAEQRTERAVEAKKQEEVRKTEVARERKAQGGGQIGLGRTIYEGDPDYNRGTLNPKMR
jgi:hypothetical protein